MKKYKIIRKVLVMGFIFLFINLGLSSLVFADDELIDVKVDLGFNNHYKLSSIAPIKVTIKNDLENIEGTLQLLFTDTSSNQKKLYTAYSKEISIAKGTTKEIDMEMYSERLITTMVIRILDNKGNEIWTDTVLTTTAKSPDTVSIGVLSDDVDSLGYLNVLMFPRRDQTQNFYNSDIAELNEAMPEKSSHLNMLNLMVINNYDTEKLNDNQRKALRGWIEKGGTVVIGTGSSYSKTLKGLDDLNFINVEDLESISNFKGLGTSLPVIKADVQNGHIIAEEDEEPLVFHSRVGLGNVIITTFDLGISPFRDWSEKEEFLSELLISYMNTYSEIDMKYQAMNNNYYRSQNIVGNIPVEKLPSPTIILIALGAFTLVVGPLNYFVLKLIDKRELTWITIPAIVVVFSAFLYIWGIGTRFDNPLINNVSIIQINDNKNVSVSTIMGTMGFNRGSVDIAFNRDLYAEILSNDYRYNNMNLAMNFNDKDIILEYLYEKDNHLIFKKRGMWDTQTIKIDTRKDIDLIIEHDFTPKDGKIVGQIKNTGSLNLEDVIITYGNTIKRIGDLVSGEIQNVEISIDSRTALGNLNRDYYNFVNSIYPRNYQPGLTLQSDVLSEDIKREILEGVLERSMGNMGAGEIQLFAWNRQPLAEGVTINGKEPDRIDRNLIVTTLNIKYERGQDVVIPYGVLWPEVIEVNKLHTELQNRRYYGEGHVVFEVKPGEFVDIKSMDINIIPNNNASSYVIELFNYEASEWEIYNNANLTIDESNLQKYYNELQGVRIKIQTTDHNVVEAPIVSITGVAR